MSGLTDLSAQHNTDWQHINVMSSHKSPKYQHEFV